MNNNNCVDLQFLNFTPNVECLDLPNNKIKCIDVSFLPRKDIKLWVFERNFRIHV